jgi:Protein of unknown function (DUF2934)
MDQSVSHRIRERAYEIWAANGYPDGQAEQHWLAAEREILEVPKLALATQIASVKKSARPARKKAKQQ